MPAVDFTDSVTINVRGLLNQTQNITAMPT